MLKKLTPFFLLLCLAFCLTACETKEPDRESTTTTITTTTHKWDKNVNYVAIPDGVEFGMTEDKIRSILSNKNFNQYDNDEHTIVTRQFYSQDPIYNSPKRNHYTLSCSFTSDTQKMYRLGYYAGELQNGVTVFAYTDYTIGVAYLERFYGTPSQEKIVWQDETYKNDKSSWNDAVSNKDVYFFTEWKVDNYYCLATSVPEGGISISYYSDRKYMPFPYLYM